MSGKEEIKCNNIIKQCKKLLTLMTLLKENIKEHDPNWPQIYDHPNRILITAALDLEKQIHYLI